MTHRAYISHVTSKDYLAKIRLGLDYIGFGQMVTSSSRLFLKPNLTFPIYQPGVMTSPAAVEAGILALLDYTPYVSVGDADSGGYNRFSMDSVYLATGLGEFAKRNGVKVVNLSHGPREEIGFTAGRRDLAVDLPSLLTQETDFLVTMPVPKIHMNTGVSLTFKNQWGCIPEPNDRLRLHPYFKEAICAVNKAVKSRVAIVDGRVGLTDSGPMRGTPVSLGWLLVATDIGAGARVVCELIQVKLDRVPHLRYAEGLGMIPLLSDIELSNELQGFVSQPFVLKRAWTDYPGVLAFQSRQLAYLAYFSPLAGVLHRALYLFREPFYDYDAERENLGG